MKLMVIVLAIITVEGRPKKRMTAEVVTRVMFEVEEGATKRIAVVL